MKLLERENDLKNAYERLKAREDGIKNHEALLKRKDGLFSNKEKEIGLRELALQKMGSEIEGKFGSLVGKERLLKEKENELKQKESEIKRREEEIEKKEKEIAENPGLDTLMSQQKQLIAEASNPSEAPLQLQTSSTLVTSGSVTTSPTPHRSKASSFRYFL